MVEDIAAPCVPAGRWIDPRTGHAVALPDVVTRAVAARIVLLGEDHDRAVHHRWQATTTAAIAGRAAHTTLALEMFPRRVQPALDRWVAGDIDADRFLAASEWRHVWGFDPETYWPIFALARGFGIPMRALNVDRTLVRRVAEHGWARVPDADREGVPTPSPASPAYRARLADAWRAHPGHGGPIDDVAFDRFVESQLVWDAAMASALRAVVAERPDAVVVGIVGRGHVEHGDGIPAQLRAMGAPEPLVAVPWDRERPCDDLDTGVADVVFGIDDGAELD